ncbi:glycoside hydrolase family 25 protein [Superficieibacter electus]|uniref:glycoside hydrolase family 25 protein n=1 Tax=Superficieibacter electus TaxID=2022662 RepID=UPI001C406207|nr:GH25 family lysozyme [Superficieibacter electus]
MNRYGRGLALLLLFIVCGLLIKTAFYEGWLRLNYPSRTQWPVQGIDISHHQKIINWALVDPKAVRFVFIKATQGSTFRDPAFQQNWQNARARGLVTGAYHFFSLCKSGKEQAQNFIATVPVAANALPPTIDLEYGANCAPQSREQVIAALREMTTMLEQVYQQKVILYATRDFYDDYLQQDFLTHPLWIRDIWRQPSLPYHRQWTFWQYANRGHIPGIDTAVDLNVFQGNSSQFDALLHP